MVNQIEKIFGQQSMSAKTNADANSIWKALCQQAEKKGSNHVVLDWVKNGGDLEARECGQSISDNLKDSLINQGVSFLSFRKGAKTIFLFRDCDHEKSTTAVKSVLNEKSRPNTILHGLDFNNQMADKKKSIVYVSGLSELEAQGISKEFSKYNGGVQYSLSRMEDNSWTIGVRQEDFVSHEKKTLKHDFMQSYLNTMFRLYGPYGKENKSSLRKDLIVERRMSNGSYKEQLKNPDSHVYLFDRSNMNEAVKLSETFFQRLEISTRNGGLFIKEMEPVAMTGENGDNRIMAFIDSMENKDNVFNQNQLVSVMKEHFTAREGVVGVREQNPLGELIFLGKMRAFFDERCEEYSIESEENPCVNAMKQSVLDFSETITMLGNGSFCPLYTVAQQNIMMKIAERFNIDTSQYHGVIEKMGNTNVKELLPEKEKVKIKESIKSAEDELAKSNYILENLEISEGKESLN